MKNNYLAKLKRTLTSVLPISKQRTGDCINCGACCKLPKRCFFLKTKSNGKSYCSIYLIRPLNCRKYPRIKSEQLTQKTCGFKFKK
ncbi:hypothetical protein HOD88_00390 [archaeon]|jgi:uncharacterized protein|nr:hypothetical protein [archaeon]